MQSELKPCPFCGSDKHMLLSPTCDRSTPYNPADRAFPIIRCGGCYTDVPGRDFDASGKSAVEAWNRRSALSDQERAVEVKPLLDPHDFASSYEFRDECGDYTPTAADRAMIEDAINGYLSEVQAARRKSGHKDDVLSALVDVPAEPVAWMHPTANWASTKRGSVLAHCRNDGPYPIPLYTRPPHREGEDSAEIYERCAKLAEERATEVRYASWAVALKRLAQEIRALAATRSASATSATGGDHG